MWVQSDSVGGQTVRTSDTCSNVLLSFETETQEGAVGGVECKVRVYERLEGDTVPDTTFSRVPNHPSIFSSGRRTV